MSFFENAIISLTKQKDLCNKELPEYAQPVEYIILPELPVTPIGKIDYRALEAKLQ